MRVYEFIQSFRNEKIALYNSVTKKFIAMADEKLNEFINAEILDVDPILVVEQDISGNYPNNFSFNVYIDVLSTRNNINKKNENEINGSNCGCDFCKHFDFNKVDIKQVLNQYEITIGNTNGGREHPFKYCPLCGRKL